MSESWWSAAPAIVLAVALFWLPGLAVLSAGWRWSVRQLLLAPAVSVAVMAGAAIVAPRVGLSWSVIPVLVVTLIVAAIAFGVRWWARSSTDPAPAPAGWVGWVSVAAALLIGGALGVHQTLEAFVGPQNISQTFDAVAHLNSVKWAVETGNASAFNVGLTSDAPFYPNGWHVVPTLLIQLLGVSVPLAVNAANIAIAAFVWPAACVALAWVWFGHRPAALIAAGVFASAFGAFPMLLFFFGVLYPNILGYALVPAGLAAGVLLLRSTGLRSGVREALGVVSVCAGLGLAHPNAFLVWCAFAAAIALHHGVERIWQDRSWRTAGIVAGLVVLGAAALVALWTLARTNYEMSRWAPWERPAQAFGEGFLVAPNGLPISFGVLAVFLIGVLVTLRQPRHLVVLWPFAVAVALFVLAAGYEVGHPLREALTNPWYNDPFRLAALLALPAVQLGALGAATIMDGIIAVAGRFRPTWRPVVQAAGGVLLLAVVVVASQGPNESAQVAQARSMYEYTDQSRLLSTDEMLLLERLDQRTPADAVIVGSPRTGTSLAYALANREVVEMHIFGQRTPDEVYLDANLRNIDRDPRVCTIVRELGVDYVLDFGTYDIHDAKVDTWAGMQDLAPSRSLVLVDQQGPNARLFEIVGCG